MAAEIEVRFDEQQVREAQRLLGSIKRGWEKAASRALNKTGRTVLSKVVKGVAKRGGYKQKDVREVVKLKRATWKNLQATIRIKYKRSPVMDAGAKQTKRGVTFKGKQGRELIRHAFIATMPSGHTGVFTRRGPIRQRAGGRYRGGRGQAVGLRQSIGEHSRSAVKVILERTPGLVQEFTAEGVKDLDKQLWTQVGLILDKGK